MGTLHPINKDREVDSLKQDIADLKDRMERLERILEGDAERGQPGLAFTVMGLHKDMSEMKNGFMILTGTLNGFKLERAKILGAAIALWTAGGICGIVAMKVIFH